MKRIITLLFLIALSPLLSANNDEFNLSSQYVSFTQDQVQFQVYLDGSFTFALPAQMQFSYRGQRSKSGRGGKVDNMSIHYSNNQSTRDESLLIDHSGILYAIGDTKLIYNEVGQLRSIGALQLSYEDGKLKQIGGLEIFYDNNGFYSHTYGSVNFTGTNNRSRSVQSDLDVQNQKWSKRNNKTRYTGYGVVMNN